MRYLWLCTFFVTLSGCASLGDKFSPEKAIKKEKALIYVYRVSKFMGSAGSPYICLDEKVVGESVNGGYFPLYISPGKHKVSLKTMGGHVGQVNFKVKKGQTYYLRHDVTMFNGASDSARTARQSALPGGGGAIGSGVGALFESSSSEVKGIASSFDRRAQKKALNPGFLFITPKVGKQEILKAERFKVPKYDKNYCAKQTK